MLYCFIALYRICQIMAQTWPGSRQKIVLGNQIFFVDQIRPRKGPVWCNTLNWTWPGLNRRFYGTPSSVLETCITGRRFIFELFARPEPCYEIYTQRGKFAFIIFNKSLKLSSKNFNSHIFKFIAAHCENIFSSSKENFI